MSYFRNLAIATVAALCCVTSQGALTVGSNTVSALYYGTNACTALYYGTNLVATWGSAPSFAPTDIAGCTLWLDATVAASFTLSGANVTAWASVAPRTPTVVMDYVTIANDIQKVSDGINGKPSVRMTYGNLGAIPIGGNAVSNMTIFVVNRPASAMILAGPVFSLSTGTCIRNTVFDTAWRNPGNDGDYTYYGGTMWINGNVGSSWEYNVAHIVSANRTPVSLDAFGIGENYTGRPYIGDIAEVITYNTQLSDVDRKRVEAYLGAKWGITVAP